MCGKISSDESKTYLSTSVGNAKRTFINISIKNIQKKMFLTDKYRFLEMLLLSPTTFDLELKSLISSL